MPALAIIGSARPGGHTAELLGRLTRGTGCAVVDLSATPIESFHYGATPPRDSFVTIVEQMVAADLTVFATPVYWFSYAAVMKNFIDRFSELLVDHQDLVEALRGRDFALLSCGANPDPEPALELAFDKFCAFFGARCLAKAYARRTDEFYDRAAADRIRERLLAAGAVAAVKSAQE
jgi:NAD(P)H-dependent FMN reductase